MKINNWSRFQHYTDRSPPWIKLHESILSSRDWLSLDDPSKLLMLMIAIIAARTDGKVPNDPAFLQQVGHLDQLPDLRPLVEGGFLLLEDGEQLQADASAVLADASMVQADVPKTITSTRARAPGDINITTSEEVISDSESMLIQGDSELVVEGGVGETKSNGASKSSKKPPPARSRLPLDFALDDKMREFAMLRGFDASSIAQMFEHFSGHHLSKASVMADWPAAWRTWVLNELRYGRSPSMRSRADDPKRNPVAAIKKLFGDTAEGDSGDDQAGRPANILRLPRG